MSSSHDPELGAPLLGAAAPDDGACAGGAWAFPPKKPKKPVVTIISSLPGAGGADGGSSSNQANGGASAAAAPRKRTSSAGGAHLPDKQSLAASVATLLLTLPALVGSWCWPLLLAGFMGITATAGAKAFSHTFSLALTLGILTNLTQYTYWKSLYKTGTLWQRQGPTILLALATPLLLADLTRHCLQDADLWPAPSSAMYRDDCDEVAGFAGLWCLTLVGWIFSIFCTYTGFILMCVAVVWSANLHTKLQEAWGQITAASRGPEPEYEL